MTIFLLWLSIFSFTVFSIALVICIFRYVRSHRAVQGVYLLIVLVFDLWLLTFTYLFFADVYLRPLSPGVRLTLGLVRTFVSGTILFLYGELIMRLAGRRTTLPVRLLLLVAPGIYCAFVLSSLRSITLQLAGIVTILYYAYLAALGLYANRVRKPRQGPVPENLRVFLWFSTVAFAALILSGVPNFFVYAGSLANVLPRAALCFFWGIAEIGVFLRRGYQAELGDDLLHPDFLEDFGITPRESEVIKLVCEGKTIRGISDSLFVAEKTVETHLYNIYRKCGCRNRVELANIVRRYQPPD
jgi:DNA-binding CsgD family transcriptional regulator